MELHDRAPDAENTTLAALRRELDDIDALIVATLGKRFAICRRIAQLKRTEAVPMMQYGRIQFVKDRVAAMAAAHEVDGDFISRLYDLVISESCRIETLVMDRADGEPFGAERGAPPRTPASAEPR